jgi:hypothetical protein
MRTFTYQSHGRSLLGFAGLLLAVAATAFIGGALVYAPAAPSDASAGFVQPAQAAARPFGNAVPAIGPAAPTDAVESGRSDDPQIPEPRECDLSKGISTACVFMD